MHDSLAKEIHDANQDGRLGKVDIETVVKWIRMALDLEEAKGRIEFVKTLILEKSTQIRTDGSSFTAGDLFPHFEELLHEHTQGVVIAALHDLCQEGRVVALDPGAATIYSFINGRPDNIEPNGVDIPDREHGSLSVSPAT